MSETGFKGTDAAGQCMGDQFSLPVQNPDGSWTPGEWHEHPGSGDPSNSGFHFCCNLAGVPAFPGEELTRIFAVEVDGVENGDGKSVCRRIRLIFEVFGRNLGNWNQGSFNQGDGNQGDGNQGSWNQGDGNQGDDNQGSWNLGNWNQGDWNKGDGNQGNENQGDDNQGSWNLGNWNQGDSNKGDFNLGCGNWGKRNIGIGCAAEHGTVGMLRFGPPSVTLWDGYIAPMSTVELTEKHPEIMALAGAIERNETINPDDYASIPGYTPERLQELIDAHKELRNA